MKRIDFLPANKSIKTFLSSTVSKYENGFFTFSYYYNANGFLNDFYNDFEKIILPLITEKIIEQDGWCEPLD